MALRLLAGLLASRALQDLRRGGREVGYAMVRRVPEVLDALRDAIANADRDAPAEPDPAASASGPNAATDFARGYRAALTDALAGFAAALDSHLEVERVAEAIGARDAHVLRAFLGEARPQVRIARELGVAAHELSRAAKRLRGAGLVKAYPGERETEQLHRVTALGRAVVRELDTRDAARVAVLDEVGFADGTPPVAETPLYAELDAWRPEPHPSESHERERERAAAPARARASSPRGGDVHELDTGSDRWLGAAADDEEDE